MLFARRGFYGTSTREIADAVGIKQPSLFHHFATKDDIMLELLEYNLNESVLVAQKEAAADGSAGLRLYRYLLFELHYTVSSPYNLAGMTSSAVLELPLYAEATEKLRQLRAARRQIIADGIASGEFVDVGIENAHRAVMWMILGLLDDVGGGGVEDPDQLAESITNLAVRSLLADVSKLEEIQRAASQR